MSNPDCHNAVASWFLGSRGENFEYLELLFKVAFCKADETTFPKTSHSSLRKCNLRAYLKASSIVFRVTATTYLFYRQYQATRTYCQWHRAPADAVSLSVLKFPVRWAYEYRYHFARHWWLYYNCDLSVSPCCRKHY